MVVTISDSYCIRIVPIFPEVLSLLPQLLHLHVVLLHLVIYGLEGVGVADLCVPVLEDHVKMVL